MSGTAQERASNLDFLIGNPVVYGQDAGTQALFLYPRTVLITGSGSRFDPLRNHGENTMVFIILHEIGHDVQYSNMGVEAFGALWATPDGELWLQNDADAYAAANLRSSTIRCPF